MGGSIPNYVCTACGKGFPSSRSARRHVRNVEFGLGSVITEADYRVSILTGKIPPPVPRSIAQGKKKNLDLLAIGTEEFTRAFYRRLGEKKADSLDPQMQQELVRIIMAQISASNISGI